jgi:hypothetical protein
MMTSRIENPLRRSLSLNIHTTLWSGLRQKRCILKILNVSELLLTSAFSQSSPFTTFCSRFDFRTCTVPNRGFYLTFRHKFFSLNAEGEGEGKGKGKAFPSTGLAGP